MALVLGRVLAAALAAEPALHEVDLVVPAPSSWTSRARRGFSMAAILAARAAPVLGTRSLRALVVHPGPRQSARPVRERRHNLVGRVRARRSVRGRVLLLDDVVTSGTTAHTCARELLCAGAEEVWLGALCAAVGVAGTGS